MPVMMRSARHQRGLSLWMILIVLLVGAAIGGALVALWVIRNVDARLLLSNQPAQVILPEPFEATARVTDDLRIQIDEVISTSVPVDVDLSLPVKDPLNIMAEFDAEVPIKLDVRVKDKILLDQVLNLDAVIDANFLGDWHKLPIRGKVPVRATVPIDLVIPVNQKVRLKFTTPVKARIKDNLNVPLKTTIVADIPIASTMDVPVLSDLKAVVTLPSDKPVNVIVNYADLLLPLRTLSLGLNDEPASTAVPLAVPQDGAQKP